MGSGIKRLGLVAVLLEIIMKYGNPSVYATENGRALPDTAGYDPAPIAMNRDINFKLATNAGKIRTTVYALRITRRGS